MIRGFVYGAISLATISSIACAEDLSTATTPLAPGTFTTSAHSDEFKIANATERGPRQHHGARSRDGLARESKY